MNAKSLSVCILLSAFAFSAYQVSGKSKQINRPNIIWLMAEDIGTDLGCYGVTDVKTPHLDQLASRGLRFTHCIATNSICSPSRSAMMTGVHQNKINAQHHRSNRDIPLPEQVKPFTYWLRKAGYTTILGHEKVMGKGMKIDCNFKTQVFGPYDGVENFGLFDKKLTFKEDDQPFFAQVQLKVTHRGDWWDDIRSQSDSPVNPDQLELPLFLEDHPVIRQDWAKFLDQIEYMDQEVGALIEELKAKGMYDNTIIIFIGDNGRCNIWGKGYLHDSGIHIPLIINWPAGIPTGAIRNDLVSTTDITATILDFARVDIPEYMTGQSFMKDDFHREYVYSTRDLWDEVMEKSRCLSSKRFRYIRNDIQEQSWDAGQAYLDFYRPALHIMRQLNKEGSLSKHASAFFDARKPHEEFYDLEKDPFELNNLIDSHEYSREIDEMRKALCAIEREYQSTDNRLNVIVPESVELLQWIKAEREDLYEQMLRGKEIGFGKLMKEFKQTRTRL